MSRPNMDDYIDVAARLAQFYELHPDGSFQTELRYLPNEVEPTTVLAKTRCYRTPDDPRPGIGHASEPIPGKTNFTRDSEAMNAETSAVGRAIVFTCNIGTKKIASAEEVRNRQDDEVDSAAWEFEALYVRANKRKRKEALAEALGNPATKVAALEAYRAMTPEQRELARLTVDGEPDA